MRTRLIIEIEHDDRFSVTDVVSVVPAPGHAKIIGFSTEEVETP
jgi:hypothetical protein